MGPEPIRTVIMMLLPGVMRGVDRITVARLANRRYNSRLFFVSTT